MQERAHYVMVDKIIAQNETSTIDIREDYSLMSMLLHHKTGY